jgi:hypothetical protein
MVVISGTRVRTASRAGGVVVSILLDSGGIDSGEYATTYNEKRGQDG